MARKRLLLVPSVVLAVMAGLTGVAPAYAAEAPAAAAAATVAAPARELQPSGVFHGRRGHHHRHRRPPKPGVRPTGGV